MAVVSRKWLAAPGGKGGGEDMEFVGQYDGEADEQT